MTHHLKTLPEFFEALLDGRKTFEIRVNDRGFSVGDTLILQEWEPSLDIRTGGKYTGRALTRAVTYITNWAQKPSMVVMALAKLPWNLHTEADLFRESEECRFELKKIAADMLAETSCITVQEMLAADDRARVRSERIAEISARLKALNEAQAKIRQGGQARGQH